MKTCDVWLGSSHSQTHVCVRDVNNILCVTHNNFLYAQRGMSSHVDRNYDRLFKVLLCGDSGVGKTCLISQFTDQQIRKSHITTIGIDFKLKTITVKGKRIRLQIWCEDVTSVC